MNILYVPSWFISKKRPLNGVFFYEQAKELSKISDNLFVIYPKEIEFGKNIVKDEENIRFFPFLKFHYKRTFLFGFFLKLFIKKIIKKYGKIDLIHAQSFLWAGIECAKISKKFNIPLIITEHHSRFLVVDEKTKIKKLINEAISISSKVVFVSSPLRSSFCQKMKLNENELNDKFLVIPNSVSDRFFQTKEFFQINDSLKEYFNDNKKFIFISIGNLKPAKGFDILIDAFHNAFSNVDDVELFIGGDGPLKFNLIEKISKLKVQNKVILLGQLNREEVEYVLEHSNCFAIASRFETFGVVLIEALAKGLPVIATDCGGPKDIVNQDCGILVKSEDIDALADAMKKIFFNYKKYDNKKIKQFAFENFSETAFIEKYRKLYLKVIEEENY